MVETTNLQNFWPPRLDPFRNFASRVADWFAPPSDASSIGEAYQITLELPGVSEEDIEISVHDRVLSVSGQKSAEREEKGEHWYFRERQFGSFARSFRLPPDADPEGVSADLRDGVLVLTVAKVADTKAAPKQIKINRG